MGRGPTKVKAVKVAKCVRLGMTDAELMERFGISAETLRDLCEQLVAREMLTREELDQRPNLAPGSVVLEVKKTRKSSGKHKKSRIDAADALNCIRAGMDDKALMERYNLTAKGLQSLLDKLFARGIVTRGELEERVSMAYGQVTMGFHMPKWPVSKVAAPEINAADALQCIKAGMSDVALMERYHISAKGLQSLFEKLVVAGMLTTAELEDRDTLASESVIVDFQTPSPAAIRQRDHIRISMQEALKCVQSGMDDSALMKKFNLSAGGLQTLFSLLEESGAVSRADILNRSGTISPPIEVDWDPPEGPDPANAAAISEDELVESVRNGMDLNDLIDHFRVSEDELNDSLESLLVNDTITEDEFDRVLFPSAGNQRIRHRATRRIICSGNETSLRALVISAVSRGVDLSGADLAGVNLARGNLSKASLSGADLTRANLIGADLSEADLTGATLAYAEMFGTTLQKADMSGADMTNANLTMVYGLDAILRDADLTRANLANANLAGADLTGSTLDDVAISGANFTGAFVNGEECADTTPDCLNLEDIF